MVGVTPPDAIYLPGGMPGAENLANNQDLMNFIETCFKANKIIAAICAAPVVVLAKTSILEGKDYAMQFANELTRIIQSPQL